MSGPVFIPLPDEYVPVPFTNERSAWLRGVTRDRMEVVAKHLPFLQPGYIQTGISGPVPKPGSVEDRTCDRCSAVPEAGIFPFRLVFVLDGFIIYLVGGLCRACADIEGWEINHDPAE